MKVIELRERLITVYCSHTQSVIRIQDELIEELVSTCLDEDLLWPDPLMPWGNRCVDFSQGRGEGNGWANGELCAQQPDRESRIGPGWSAQMPNSAGLHANLVAPRKAHSLVEKVDPLNLSFEEVSSA